MRSRHSMKPARQLYLQVSLFHQKAALVWLNDSSSATPSVREIARSYWETFEKQVYPSQTLKIEVFKREKQAPTDISTKAVRSWCDAAYPVLCAAGIAAAILLPDTESFPALGGVKLTEKLYVDSRLDLSALPSAGDFLLGLILERAVAGRSELANTFAGTIPPDGLFTISTLSLRAFSEVVLRRLLWSRRTAYAIMTSFSNGVKAQKNVLTESSTIVTFKSPLVDFFIEPPDRERGDDFGEVERKSTSAKLLPSMNYEMLSREK